MYVAESVEVYNVNSGRQKKNILNNLQVSTWSVIIADLKRLTEWDLLLKNKGLTEVNKNPGEPETRATTSQVL